ncbi:MAG: hypothetical protein RSC01_05840 [Oscillospiraceae bacterium]
MKNFYLTFCVIFSILILFTLGGFESDTLSFGVCLCFVWIFGEGAYYSYIEYKRRERLERLERMRERRDGK